MLKRFMCLVLILCTLTPVAVMEEAEISPRAQLIEDYLHVAKELYEEANGRLKRAHYAGDIYVCKNFTTHVFSEVADSYRMAEFPDAALYVPDNLPKDECTTHVYGCEWKDISPEEGNPFIVAASFRYDASLSKSENEKLAREFLMQAQRGDYFQMAAKYYYGTGAHSMIITGDYNPDTDTILWCDSNMKGERKDGIRYGKVQFDAEKDIDWFVDAFCRKKYGATLYRLREDIVFAE
ncbi:MAG: hypothetical protein E7326_01280 [Clostridiales bacterium]|nr:hypothetical protein [Clostridiales bacterium]